MQFSMSLSFLVTTVGILNHAEEGFQPDFSYQKRLKLKTESRQCENVYFIGLFEFCG